MKIKILTLLGNRTIFGTSKKLVEWRKGVKKAER